MAHVAQDVGVHREALRRWVRQAEVDQGQRSDRPTSADLEDLKRLRKKSAELRRANEILKLFGRWGLLRREPTLPARPAGST